MLTLILGFLLFIALMIIIALNSTLKLKARDNLALLADVTILETKVDSQSRTIANFQTVTAAGYGALYDIATQNNGDPQYHIWARKRAQDAWDRFAKPIKKGN